MNSTTHHFGENYELYAFLRDHELQLVLKVRKDLGKYTIFKTILDNESLEKLMEKNLRDIEIIYEYLKEKESFVVKEQEGKIVLKTIMTVGKKIITSESQIILEEEKDQYFKNEKVIQKMQRQIADLQHKLIEKQENEEKLETKILKVLKNEMKEEFRNLETVVLQKNEQSDEKKFEEQDFKSQIVKKVESLELKVKRIARELEESIIENDKLKKQNFQLSQKIEVLENKVNIPIKIEKQTKSPQKTDNKIKHFSKTEIDITQKFLKSFKLQNRKIQYIGEDQERVKVFGKYSLTMEDYYEFKFKVISSKYGSLSFGICTKTNQYLTKNTGFYFNGDCGQICFEDCQPYNLHSGLRNNNLVKLTVQRNTLKAKFEVDGKGRNITSKKFQQFLSNPQNIIFPYISFYRYGDVVEWIQ